MSLLEIIFPGTPATLRRAWKQLFIMTVLLHEEERAFVPISSPAETPNVASHRCFG